MALLDAATEERIADLERRLEALEKIVYGEEYAPEEEEE